MTQSIPDKPLYRIVLLGSPGVGKKTLIGKFLELGSNGEQHDRYKDLYYMDYIRQDGKIQIEFTNAGIEHTGQRDMSIKRAHAAILIYSLIDHTSFNGLGSLLPVFTANQTVQPKLLLGNKSDLRTERQVKRQGGQHLAHRFGATDPAPSAEKGRPTDQDERPCPFVELSIRYMTDQKQVLNGLLREIYTHHPQLLHTDKHKPKSQPVSTLCVIL